MKLILILGFVFSSSLFASETCVDLAGNYYCRGFDGKDMTVKIEQEGNEFYIDGVDPLERVIADGNRQNVVNSSQYRNANYTANCLAKKLQANGSADIYKNGWPLGKVKFTLELGKVTNDELEININGSLHGPLGSMPVRERRICKTL